MKSELSKLEKEFQKALTGAKTVPLCQALRVDFFGKKGKITSLLRSIGQLPPKERATFGSLVNEVREKLEAELDSVEQKLQFASEEKAIQSERVDIGLPGRKALQGAVHPLAVVERKIVRVFESLGFSVATGPDVETDYYNFEALNFPKEHPARDMQDTFFVDGEFVLRTHTSPVQIRTMENEAPPIRVMIPGRVYRHDSDVTHSPVFHQVEGLCVGPDITFAHLKGTIQAFIHMMFGPEIKARFRPSFFPFTEPSAEVDMECGSCRGKGCRICKQTGWIEILGCGMVHPNVFSSVGEKWKAKGKENPYDPEKISGFAWGMGVERIAMVLSGIDDIRLFYENDVRFLNQFKGSF